MRSALSSGAAGFVLKRAAHTDLLLALRAVARGGVFVDPTVSKDLFSSQARDGTEILSHREQQVVRLLAQGFGNQEIASRLLVSVKTIETYRGRIADKLGLKTRRDITRYALATGLLTVQDALQEDDSVA